MLVSIISRRGLRSIRRLYRQCSSLQASTLTSPDSGVSASSGWLANRNSTNDDRIIYDKSLDTKISAFAECDPEYIEQVCPPIEPTFNLAAYINKHPTLQKMVDMGVDLYFLERDRAVSQYLIRLDFDRDMRKHVETLIGLGVHSDNMGRFITTNPTVFEEDIRNLMIRVDYLKWKRFKRDAIVKIINENPKILSMEVKELDARLCSLMKVFRLESWQVRRILTEFPAVANASYLNHSHTFYILKDDGGFDLELIKSIVVELPQTILSDKRKIINNVDYLLELVKIDHRMISLFPELLLVDSFQLKARYKYLLKLDLACFDPNDVRYIPPSAFYASDLEFVSKHTRTSIHDFNTFLKTL